MSRAVECHSPKYSTDWSFAEKTFVKQSMMLEVGVETIWGEKKAKNLHVTLSPLYMRGKVDLG